MKLDFIAGGDVVIMYRSATRLVLDVLMPQTLGFSVTTRSPGQYKLVTQLVETPASRDPFTKTEPEDVDPDPEEDGLVSCPPLKTEPEDVDPDPEEDGLVSRSPAEDRAGRRRS